ncbi:AMP-binding protein, partial [Candidatus Sumerlaeota bacterium]|nr:AMP-binding protein [Candidatus Sumerlaeota bacterium]
MQERVIGTLERAALQYGDKIGMIDGDERLTYREFAERVYMLANGLRSIGVKQGDSVAALCMNHWRYMQIYFACHAMGAIVNPLNIRLNPAEICYILTDSKTKVLFIDQPFIPMLAKIREGTACLKNVYFSDSGDTPEGVEHINRIVNGQSPQFTPPEINENDVAGYFYTGGTTGMPKGVMLTHRNLMSNAFHLQSTVAFVPSDVYLHIAPMFHLADAGSFYALTMSGGTHVFGRAFDPKLTLELIQQHRVTKLLLVPTMVNFVLSHPDFSKYDLTSLVSYTYGASPMPVALLRRAMEKIPCAPIQGYGMTEAAPLVTALTGEEHKK